MTVYSIFEKPQEKAAKNRAPLLVPPVTVPERFSWTAAIVPPLFAVLNGLWLLLIFWIALVAGLAYVSRVIGDDAAFWLYVLVAVFMGFEAPAFRRRQIVMGFVEHDLVGQPRLAPHGRERRQELAQVVVFFLTRQLGQVDDDAGVRIAQRLGQLAHARRRIAAAQHHDARQRFERQIVTLRINDAQAIALQDQLLAVQARQPRLTGSGLSRNDHGPTANRNLDRTPVMLVAEEQPAAAHLTRRQAKLRRQAA